MDGSPGPLFSILFALAAAVVFSAAASAFVLLWLWRTPLCIRGHASAGLTRAADASAEITLYPFRFDLIRIEGKVQLRLRAGRRTLMTVPVSTPLSTRKDEGEKTNPRPEQFLRALRFVDRHWGIGATALHLAGCLRFVTLEEFSGYIEFGSTNPAVTGEIYGYLCSATPLWARLPGFRWQPNWSPGGAFQFDVTVSAGFYFLRMIASTLWFLVRRFRWQKPATPALPPAILEESHHAA